MAATLNTLPSSLTPLISEKQLVELTGFTKTYFQKARTYGGGPPFIKIGRTVRYRLEDVEAWLASMPRLANTAGGKPE